MVVKAKATDVVLRDPLTGGPTIPTGDGIARVETGGQPSVKGTVMGAESLIGTSNHGDRLSGTWGPNVIEGLGGDDIIFGDGFRAAYAAPQAAQVWRLYQVALHRAPDAVGYNDWTERLVTGTSSLREVADGILGSHEFYRSHGETANFAFAGHLYRTVLDRAYDVSETNSWEYYVPGERRPELADVLLGFAGSREFANKTRAEAAAFAAVPTEAAWTDDVFRLYQATLGRAPDAEGLLNWLGRLGSGMPFLTAVEGFTERRAFQNAYGGLDDTALVTLLYDNVLDRAADAAELAGWVGQMAGGATRAEVVAGFSQSREFVNDTAEAVTDFVRAFGGGDTLDGGAGDNRLWGGMLADEFVFDADDMAHHRVMDFEAWDFLTFQDFGYAAAQDIRARMTQVGADVVFHDQGVTVTLANTQLAAIADDSFLFS